MKSRLGWIAKGTVRGAKFSLPLRGIPLKLGVMKAPERMNGQPAASIAGT